MSTQANQKIFGIELGFKVESKLTRWVGILMAEIIVIIITGWLILVPRIEAITAVQTSLERNRKLLTNLQIKLGLIDDFGVEFAGGDEVMTATFLASKDPGMVLSGMREVANLSGMSIVNFSIPASRLVGAQTAAKGMESLEIELTVSGQAQNVSPFLRRLDESLPIKRVTSLEVAQGSLQSGVLQLNMNVSTFVYPALVQVNTLGLIQPFSEANRQLFSQLGGFTRSLTTGTATASAQLGNPNLFGL